MSLEYDVVPPILVQFIVVAHGPVLEGLRPNPVVTLDGVPI